MPWHIENDNPDCAGYAVVKDSTGEIEGCHETEQGAKQQLAALYSNEPRGITPMSNLPRENLLRASYPAVELRSEGEGMPTMTGYFARFNEWTKIDSAYEGTFLERIAPGAFARTLKNNRDSIRVLFQHGRDPQVGDKPLGPIADVGEDGEGAHYDVPLLDTSYTRDLLPGLAAGLYGSSFRFSVLQEDFDPKPRRSTHNPEGIPERTIREARVMEFGPVTFPAYAGATAGVRSMTFDDLDAALQPPQMTEALPGVSPAAKPHADVGTRETVAVTQARDTEKATNMKNEYRTLDEMGARVRELDAEIARMAEIPGVLPDDEQADFDAKVAERAEVEHAMTAWRNRRTQVRQAADEGSTEEVYSPPNVIRSRTETDIFDIQPIVRASSPEKRDQLWRDNAMRAVEQMRIPHPRIDDATAKGAMADLLDYRDTPDKEFARRVLTTGSPQYRRDFAAYLRTGGEQRGTALAVGVDGTGGYAVPVAFDPTVIAIGAHSFNPYRAVCRVETVVGTDTFQALTATAITAAYATEAAAATEQGPTFARPEFIAKRAHAFVTASYEMAQDRPDLAGELSVLFQEAKDNLEENQFSIGVGTTVYPQGIALAGAFTSVTTATNDVTAIGDLYLVEAGLPIRHKPNAVWFLSRAGIRAIQGWETAMGVLFNGLYYGNAGNLGRPNAFGNTGLQLLGYPVFESPSIPWTPTTDAAINGVLFDPRNYLILDRVGMSVKVIPDMLNGATPSFPTGEIGIYAFWRGTARVLNADGGRQLKVQ